MYRVFMLICFVLLGAVDSSSQNIALLKKDALICRQQIKNMLKKNLSPENQIPRSLTPEGSLKTVNIYDWTSGFFAGCLWQTYKLTGDTSIKNAAIKYTHALSPIQFYKQNHDVGFMMYCSYGNEFDVLGDTADKKVLIQAARSLCSRYNSVAGCIKSWDRSTSNLTGKERQFTVIMDNMMNLELLFYAYKTTKDPMFKNIAISHAEHTLRNHLRSNYSSYHVVDYDTISGKVLSRETAQGYANNSTWARGQAWGIYGFTMVYRETGKKEFLHSAVKMADFYLHNARLPADKIPYWDFNAGLNGYTPIFKYDLNLYPEPPRDASAAAIVCSALFELSTFNISKRQLYFKEAERILKSLSSTKYMANVNTNKGFILKHSVGNMPAGYEIDVPLIYADYYFLEALNRYKKIILKSAKM